MLISNPAPKCEFGGDGHEPLRVVGENFLTVEEVAVTPACLCVRRGRAVRRSSEPEFVGFVDEDGVGTECTDPVFHDRSRKKDVEIAVLEFEDAVFEFGAGHLAVRDGDFEFARSTGIADFGFDLGEGTDAVMQNDDLPAAFDFHFDRVANQILVPPRDARDDGLLAGGGVVRSETLRTPESAKLRLRGIGVAESEDIDVLAERGDFFLIQNAETVFFGSTTRSPRSRKRTSVESRRCVPTTMSTVPSLSPLRMSRSSASRVKRVSTATFTRTVRSVFQGIPARSYAKTTSGETKATCRPFNTDRYAAFMATSVFQNPTSPESTYPWVRFRPSRRGFPRWLGAGRRCADRERLAEGFFFVRSGDVRRTGGELALGVDVEKFHGDLFRVHFGLFGRPFSIRFLRVSGASVCLRRCTC